MARSSFYAPILSTLLATAGRPDIDPRHVEGYLRLQYSTLDGLSRPQLAAELPEVVMTVDADPDGAEELARSYGL